MATRAVKLRRRQHRKDKKSRPARQAQPALSPDFLLIETPPGKVKMSEALLELLDFEWQQCEDDASLRKLLTIGVAAWNAALVQGLRRTELVEKLAQGLPSAVRQDFRDFVDALIRRKEQLFSANRRPILDFQLTWPAPRQPYVQVISALSDLP